MKRTCFAFACVALLAVAAGADTIISTANGNVDGVAESDTDSTSAFGAPVAAGVAFTTGTRAGAPAPWCVERSRR